MLSAILGARELSLVSSGADGSIEHGPTNHTSHARPTITRHPKPIAVPVVSSCFLFGPGAPQCGQALALALTCPSQSLHCCSARGGGVGSGSAVCATDGPAAPLAAALAMRSAAAHSASACRLCCARSAPQSMHWSSLSYILPPHSGHSRKRFSRGTIARSLPASTSRF